MQNEIHNIVNFASNATKKNHMEWISVKDRLPEPLKQ